jgi:hypothetical protein
VAQAEEEELYQNLGKEDQLCLFQLEKKLQGDQKQLLKQLELLLHQLHQLL